MTSETFADAHTPVARIQPGVWLLLLAAGGLAVLFWPGLLLLSTAWETAEYSHGYLIPPIAAYLFLRQLSLENKVVSTDPRRGVGVIVVCIATLTGVFAVLADAPALSAYGLVLAIAGLLLVTLGFRRGIRYWPAIIYLGFMLPLPFSVYLPISSFFQTISSEIGVWIISKLGVSVFLDGNVIDLGNYKLQVAEACSGLRYLFPLASFSFLFAVLYRGPLLHKFILFLSAIPIAVLMNSVRIGVIGFLVNSYGIEQAEGFLHFFEGWVIFIACILLLYFEAVLLQRTLRQRIPVHAMLDLDFARIGSCLAGVRSIPPSPALVASAVIIVLASVAVSAAPSFQGATPARQPFVLFPLDLGERHGTVRTLEPVIEQVLAAEDYLAIEFAGARSPSIDLFIAYYKSRHQGVGIHDPRICIPGAGWEVVSWDEASAGVKTPDGEPLEVNRAVIRKGANRQLVYYWFKQGERAIASASAYKVYSITDAVTRGRTDSALVRLITPIAPNESVEVADRRLQDFLVAVLPVIPQYVPD